MPPKASSKAVPKASSKASSKAVPKASSKAFPKASPKADSGSKAPLSMEYVDDGSDSDDSDDALLSLPELTAQRRAFTREWAELLLKYGMNLQYEPLGREQRAKLEAIVRENGPRRDVK